MTDTRAASEPVDPSTALASSRRRRAWMALRVALILGSIYLVLSYVLGAMLFHPSRDEGDAARFAERVEYTSRDGVRLRSWMVRARGERRRTLVYFHGNGGLAAGSIGWGQWLAERGTDVLLAEYRGYGASDGSPSAAGVEDDADAAIRFLLDQEHVPPRQLVVHGQSLGGAAAIAALAGPARDAAGGIIESSFTSLHDMARQVIGVPLTYLVLDAYHLNSARRAGDVRAPILQFHGDADTLIPFAQGEQLRDLLRSRHFVRVPGGEHNLMRGAIDQQIAEFLDEVTP